MASADRLLLLRLRCPWCIPTFKILNIFHTMYRTNVLLSVLSSYAARERIDTVRIICIFHGHLAFISSSSSDVLRLRHKNTGRGRTASADNQVNHLEAHHGRYNGLL